jgi:hypothetical protein
MQERDILAEMVVKITGNVAVCIVLDFPRLVRKRVPDRGLLARLVRSTLDLVGGYRHTDMGETYAGREEHQQIYHLSHFIKK